MTLALPDTSLMRAPIAEPTCTGRGHLPRGRLAELCSNSWSFSQKLRGEHLMSEGSHSTARKTSMSESRSEKQKESRGNSVDSS